MAFIQSVLTKWRAVLKLKEITVAVAVAIWGGSES
jgi:hypothetical protein